MQECFEQSTDKYIYTQNRELSWLNFNRRVLHEAADKTVPLMERLKFVSIFRSNLDEFFMVRVGSLLDIEHISPNERDNKNGMTPGEQLEKIYAAVPGLIEEKAEIYGEITDRLAEFGIKDVPYEELTNLEREFVRSYFKDSLLPIISPIVIGSHRPMPHLISKKLYVLSLLKNKKDKNLLGMVSVPDSLSAYVNLPEKTRFIRTENIIKRRVENLYGNYKVRETAVISVTRNADISYDDEKFDDDDFRDKMEKLLKQRNRLSVTRIEINDKISKDFEKLICKALGTEENVVFYDFTPLNMKYIFSIAGSLSGEKYSRLFYQPYTPRLPEDLTAAKSIIDLVRQGDKMLFYPFDSVEPFLKLLNEAAEREDVISIKITIYRLATYSKIARALCKAAENGKEVIVSMELRARFDEANNIEWSKVLEDAGCQVEYGDENFKCHSKICLITLKNKGKISHITQIGTGNYNEKTNAMYTDLSLITASEKIGADGELFFKNIMINNTQGDYKALAVSPRGIKEKISRLMDREIAKGSDGYIFFKVNSVTERDIIDKLRQASQAGVRVDMIVRGICCIVPGIPGYTENIHITSIVGKYLEHARIYAFGKGDDACYYISSADLMTRNLNRRIEIACPIYDKNIIRQIRKIMEIQLSDNVKASYLTKDGIYVRKTPGENPQIDSQSVFEIESTHQKPQVMPAVKKQETVMAKITAVFGGLFKR